MPICKTCCGGRLQVRYDEVTPVMVLFDERGEEISCEALDEYLYRRNPYVLCADCGAVNADTGYTVRTLAHGRFRLEKIEVEEVTQRRMDEAREAVRKLSLIQSDLDEDVETVVRQVHAQYYLHTGPGSYAGDKGDFTVVSCGPVTSETVRRTIAAVIQRHVRDVTLINWR